MIGCAEYLGSVLLLEMFNQFYHVTQRCWEIGRLGYVGIRKDSMLVDLRGGGGGGGTRSSIIY